MLNNRRSVGSEYTLTVDFRINDLVIFEQNKRKLTDFGEII